MNQQQQSFLDDINKQELLALPKNSWITKLGLFSASDINQSKMNHISLASFSKGTPYLTRTFKFKKGSSCKASSSFKQIDPFFISGSTS